MSLALSLELWILLKSMVGQGIEPSLDKTLEPEPAGKWSKTTPFLIMVFVEVLKPESKGGYCLKRILGKVLKTHPFSYMKAMANRFYGSDVISARDFSREDLEFLYRETDRITGMDRQERMKLAEGRILGYMFFEPSTRTRMSFEAAMLSIGGRTLGFSEPQTSSVAKGESLADTVRVMEGYVDVMVLRHPMDGAARFAAEKARKPLINGGSGQEEHPTQAMLDLYTIRKLCGRIDGVKIGLVGDMRYARGIRSLIYAASKFSPIIYTISPPELRLREDVKWEVGEKLKLVELDSLEEVIGELDVLYTLRVQKERFTDPALYERVKDSYYINRRTLEKAKGSLVVLHPMPRVTELDTDVDDTPHAKYFQQAAWGKEMRSALLNLILNP